MGPFEMVVCIVLIVTIAKLVKAKIEARERVYGIAAERNTDLLARIDKIEQRLANLETLVLDAEKKKDFERL